MSAAWQVLKSSSSLHGWAVSNCQQTSDNVEVLAMEVE